MVFTVRKEPDGKMWKFSHPHYGVLVSTTTAPDVITAWGRCKNLLVDFFKIDRNKYLLTCDLRKYIESLSTDGKAYLDIRDDGGLGYEIYTLPEKIEEVEKVIKEAVEKAWSDVGADSSRSTSESGELSSKA